jgi:hypothetical protein
MLKFLGVFSLALMFSAVVASKEAPYQDAVLLGSESVADGSNCSGSVDQWGDIYARCKDRYAIHYKIAFDGYIYTVRKTSDHPTRAMFTSWPEGVGVLATLPKGSTIKIRINEKSETISIKVDKKESRYAIVPGTVRQ